MGDMTPAGRSQPELPNRRGSQITATISNTFRAESGDNLSGMAHILVIDDDRSVGMTLSRMLELDGQSGRDAESAQDGLTQAVDERPPDAILLDMRMPPMGGLDFLRTPPRPSRPRSIPVGIVTGDYFLDEQIPAELAALGATIRYKPLWMDDLQALMRALLGPGRRRADRS